VPTYEQIPGLIIQFKDGTTELEVRAILEKYNLPTYNLIYNWDNRGYKHYIKVKKDKMPDVVGEGLNKDENWTDPLLYYFAKDDYIEPIPKATLFLIIGNFQNCYHDHDLY